MSTRVGLELFARDVEGICSHVSIRETEDGPYVFALGARGLHTLQLRKSGGQYIIQLWLGASAEDERIVDEPKFATSDEAFRAAQKWLLLDRN